MTTLQQAIANLQRTEANSGYPDVDHFCQALDFFPMGWNETFSARCKSYWLERWMCTDTMVGTAVVYVDDTPVEVSKTLASVGSDDVFNYLIDQADRSMSVRNAAV
jgi:hypothetical protein